MGTETSCLSTTVGLNLIPSGSPEGNRVENSVDDSIRHIRRDQTDQHTRSNILWRRSVPQQYPNYPPQDPYPHRKPEGVPRMPPDYHTSVNTGESSELGEGERGIDGLGTHSETEGCEAPFTAIRMLNPPSYIPRSIRTMKNSFSTWSPRCVRHNPWVDRRVFTKNLVGLGFSLSASYISAVPAHEKRIGVGKK